MELFRNIRIRAGKAMLSGKAARLKRKPYYNSFNNIKSIGIVWDASRTEEFRILSAFYQRMAEKHIEVVVFGAYPGKELPDQYTAIRYLTCLKKQELDYFYRPVSPEAIAFMERKFDVLIDINFRNIFPLRYITSLSKAGLKVGLSDPDPADLPFDLMISVKNPVSLDRYLDQVLYYLEMMNSGTEKKAV
jgi:hypothetical protein